ASEPAGSAGPPILQVLEAQGLLNVLIVVVRYFGGTRLGLGGLSRAYADVAREALAQAEIVTEVQRERLQLRYPAELTGKVLRLVNQYHAEIEAQVYDYDEGPRLTLSLPRSQLERFRLALREATSGQIEFGEPEG
ncbi:MAG: YigZ family protein, partial [Candidatus Bipolaricaulia bacterium]